jgi:hypothetical protein
MLDVWESLRHAPIAAYVEMSWGQAGGPPLGVAMKGDNPFKPRFIVYFDCATWKASQTPTSPAKERVEGGRRLENSYCIQRPSEACTARYVVFNVPHRFRVALGL